MSEKTLIRTTVDLDANGKQVGFLSVPISTNESAYGALTIPITVIKNGDGPTMSFTGGVHGDEYEGPITLMKLSKALESTEINGRIIIIPSLNLPAVLSGNRCSPIDGLNLNRVFPGKPNGTVTEMIADYITSEIVPRSDIHMDLHSGGKTLEYVPSIFVPYAKNQEDIEAMKQASLCFGANYAIFEDDAFPDSGRFLSAVFTQAGKPTFTCELAGAGRVTPTAVKIGERGCRNLLKHFQVLQSEITNNEETPDSDSKLVTIEDTECYIQAPDDGLYEPFIDLNDDISKGQTIGQVHYPQHHEKAPWEVVSNRNGFLICKRPPGKVVRGDNIAIIARPV
jgi:N-alpha-acetyl-L-2,4-diaminobutyrate deacetylase